MKPRTTRSYNRDFRVALLTQSEPRPLKLVNNHDSKGPIENIATKTVLGAFINYLRGQNITQFRSPFKMNILQTIYL